MGNEAVDIWGATAGDGPCFHQGANIGGVLQIKLVLETSGDALLGVLELQAEMGQRAQVPSIAANQQLRYLFVLRLTVTVIVVPLVIATVGESDGGAGSPACQAQDCKMMVAGSCVYTCARTRPQNAYPAPLQTRSCQSMRRPPSPGEWGLQSGHARQQPPHDT